MNRMVKVPEAFCETVTVVASLCYQIKIVILYEAVIICMMLFQSLHRKTIEIFVNKQINLYFSEGTLKVVKCCNATD